MKVLVAGATGATGRLLVEQLLQTGHQVHVVVRDPARISEHLIGHEGLSVTTGTVLNMDLEELSGLLKDCDAIASCLGHNLDLKGMYGKPRRLVADSVRRICSAIEDTQPEQPVRVVLMNTTGNSNRDLKEPASFGQRLVVGLLRVLLPPQADNEQAADYLRIRIGQNNESVEWVAVRPDTLINEDQVTEYEIHPSPVRSPVFNPGKTSRINVAHFMAKLITDDQTWNEWKGRMPVIYNKSSL